jgi:UDP-glucuronate 4-epimerase
VVAAIEAASPEAAGRITWVDERLPFPETLEATALERLVGPLPHTPLAHGVRRTIEHFRNRHG